MKNINKQFYMLHLFLDRLRYDKNMIKNVIGKQMPPQSYIPMDYREEFPIGWLLPMLHHFYTLTWLSWKASPGRFKKARLLVASPPMSWNINSYQDWAIGRWHPPSCAYHQMTRNNNFYQNWAGLRLTPVTLPEYSRRSHVTPIIEP